MNAAIAGLCAAGVAGAYLPTLRDQLRGGRVDIPFGSINPITIRRDEHPLAFRIGAACLVAMIGLILAASLVLVARALIP